MKIKRFILLFFLCINCNLVYAKDLSLEALQLFLEEDLTSLNSLIFKQISLQNPNITETYHVALVQNSKNKLALDLLIYKSVQKGYKKEWYLPRYVSMEDISSLRDKATLSSFEGFVDIRINKKKNGFIISLLNQYGGDQLGKTIEAHWDSKGKNFVLSKEQVEGTPRMYIDATNEDGEKVELLGRLGCIRYTDFLKKSVTIISGDKSDLKKIDIFQNKLQTKKPIYVQDYKFELDIPTPVCQKLLNTQTNKKRAARRHLKAKALDKKIFYPEQW